MADCLKFYQIYYDDIQLTELYPFAIPYKTGSPTSYFENSIIADVVPKAKSEFVSVCSWRLRKKRIDRSMQLKGQVELTEEKILSASFDVAVLTPSNNQNALHMARQWHGQPWVDALKELGNFIKIPAEVSKAIYENHFIARTEIYQEYVQTCLVPAMAYMRDKEVFFVDAKYASRKTPAEQKRYKELTGRNDWPIAPFVLERLFSIWMDGKGFNTINL